MAVSIGNETVCPVGRLDTSQYTSLIRAGRFEEARDLAVEVGTSPESRQDIGLRALVEYLLGGEESVRQMIREGRRDDLTSDQSFVRAGLDSRRVLGWPESSVDEFETLLRREFLQYYDQVLRIVSD